MTEKLENYECENQMSINDYPEYLPDKKEETNVLYDAMSIAVGEFIEQCGKMAEENWCQSQVDMLERLFGAVLKGVPYDKWEKENAQDKTNGKSDNQAAV